MTGTVEVNGVAADEFILDTPLLRRFIADVRTATAGIDSAARGTTQDIEVALDALQPSFAALLADPTWLPDEFASPYAASGMGGGIGSWLLFRAGDRSLALISLVVPPGVETPVHDHLAWGMVGLYRGVQAETVYARAAGEAAPLTLDTTQVATAHLTVAEVNMLRPGEFYKLMPPDGDIHSVKTTSAEPSVSIHLLANDIGCMVRHTFDPAAATVRAFKSGYSNMPCQEESTQS